MPTQTAASRGYVLFRGAIRDTHKSPTNCFPECGHAPSECSKLGKTRIIEDATIRLVRNAIFFEPNIPSVFPHEIPKCVSYNITYLVKQDDLLNAAAFFQERDYVF